MEVKCKMRVSKKDSKKYFWIGLSFMLAMMLVTGLVTYGITKASIKPKVITKDHIVYKNITTTIPEYHNTTIIKYYEPTKQLCSKYVDDAVSEALNESNCTLINHENIRKFITNEDCSLYCVDGHKVLVIVGDTKTENGLNYTYSAFNNYDDCLNECGVGSDACSCWVVDE